MYLDSGFAPTARPGMTAVPGAGRTPISSSLATTFSRGFPRLRAMTGRSRSYIYLAARGEMRGRFITFEGGEGTGKSTHATILANRLGALNIDVVKTREPGGSPGAEIIRHVLLSGAAKPLGPEAETMLFASARDDHLRTTIRPALARGAWVICDRFADSTRVYQGIVGSVDP